MAEDKKKVIVYADWIYKFEALEDSEAGRLIKHFFRYINDLSPEYPDRITEISFIDIQNTLKRDLKKWEEKSPARIEKARIAGIASSEARKLKNELNLTTKLKSELKQTKSTVSVNVSDSVNDNVIVNDILLKKETKFNFKKNLIEYGFSENLVNDWLIVRKNKKASNTETAFNSFIAEIMSSKDPTVDLNYILKICCEKSWSGFKWKWIDNLEKQNNNGKSTGKTEQVFTGVGKVAEYIKRIEDQQ